MNNDLISREVLKKALNEMFDTFDVISFDDIIATINNAPAIAICKEDCTSCYHCKYKNVSRFLYPCCDCKHVYENMFKAERGDNNETDKS